MTSKQVVKAHKTSSRQARVSRAEQLRLERLELERIRKEEEKGKASAKARAARLKKKEEEQAKLDERRRKGLPLKDVTSSQAVLTGLFFRNTKLSTSDGTDKENASKSDNVVTGVAKPSQTTNPT
jgi:hypothetical protein